MFTLEPGKYVIGDPCYILSSEDYRAALEQTNYFDRPFEKDGLKVVAFQTKFGDGTYADGDGFQYGVDSGLIAIASRELFDGMADLKYIREVEFFEPFDCVDDDGLLQFGDVEIDTDPQPNLDDDEFYDDDIVDDEDYMYEEDDDDES